MPYADQPRRLTYNAPRRGREGKAYRDACAIVRERVRLGARCWFWRRPGHEACPGRINLALPGNHRWAFTAHHLERLMDGGAAVVSAHAMVPAHRACNARDGLIAQNARRAAQRTRGVRGAQRARGAGGGAQQVHVTRGYQTKREIDHARTIDPLHTVIDRGIDRDRQSRRW